MQNELAKIFAVAFTIIAIVSESALIISGLMYECYGQILVALCGLVVIIPLTVSMWDDVRKDNV